MRELERDLPTTARRAPEPTGPVSALAIVGAGRVGSSIARAARAAGIDVSIGGRDRRRRRHSRGGRGAPLRPRRGDLRGRGHDRAGWLATAVRGPHERRDGAGGARARWPPPGPRPSRCTRCRRWRTARPTSPPRPARSRAATASALGLARALAIELGMRPFEIAEETGSPTTRRPRSPRTFSWRSRSRPPAYSPAPASRTPASSGAARPADRRELVGARRRRAHGADRPW